MKATTKENIRATKEDKRLVEQQTVV